MIELSLALIYAMGSVICHQLPERSFFLGGRQFPVCGRCTGLYLSAVVGVIGWFAFKIAGGWRPHGIHPRTALRILALAAAPTALSLASGAIGAWDGSNLTRALLAAPLGMAAGAVVAAVSTKDLR